MSDQHEIRGSTALKQEKVIVIKAAEQPEAQKQWVAAYCRVSSDSSDQLNSFMAQLNYYTTLISNEEKWTMADIYADEGLSGTSMEKRQDFQRLLSDCRKGRVDKILVKSISRFARNTKDCLETIRELKSMGVGVCFEEQGIDTSDMSGELLTAVFAAIAQKESESISANMRWSYKRRMESGTYVPTVLPYGYKRKDNRIVIDENCAEVIRRIFVSYLAGQSTDDIAAALSSDKIPRRYGGTDWNSTAVRYILTNEKYTGNSLWQKYYTTDTLPYRHPRNKGERESYYAEGTHEPIIPMEDYEAVQRLMAERRQMIAPAQYISYPFRKKIYCGICGTIFRRKVVHDTVCWVCMGHDRQGNGFCPVTQIPEEEIKAAFLQLYHKLRFHGETIFTQMLSDLQKICEQRMLWSIDIIELNKQIYELTDQNRTLADMNKLGLVDPDIFMSQSNELARQLQRAKRAKERLIGNRDDDTIPQTRMLLEMLEAMPEFLPNFDGEIFGDLVEKITAESNTCLRFHLKNGMELTEQIRRTAR